MIDLRSGRLLDLVPPVIADDPDIIAMCAALDPEIREIASCIDDINIMARLDEQPEAVLDSVAWSVNLLGLPVYENADVNGKRSLLKEIFGVRRRAGTVWSVKRVFLLLRLAATLIEWWEEGADPYTYRVRLDASENGITREQLLQIPELLRRFAPTRNLLTETTIEATVSGAIRVYPVITRGRIVTISGGP